MIDDIRSQCLDDARQGALRSLEEYQVQFPGHEAEVASVYADVLEQSRGHTPMEQASRSTVGAEGLGQLERRDPQILEEIASGGMGTVYAVRDDVLRRDLAMKKVTLVKVPEAATDNHTTANLRELPNLLRRLMEEAQITAQLDHSGVVPVHELGIDSDGHLFFTMKRVRGRTLAEVFEMVRGRGGWSLSRALQVFIKICQTIAYAHGKGVIHRDLKPANIMVGRFGEVYVMDWGLAKVQGAEDADDDVAVHEAVSTDQSEIAQTDASQALTMHGDVLGTLGYMAPEQAQGDTQRIDERTDVYAVGAMLYELLAGHAPYREPNDPRRPHEVLLDMRRGPPPSLASLAPEAAPELISITDKAMATDPEARFASMEEMSNDLHAFLDGRVVQSHERGVWIELKKWIARNKVAAASIVAGLVLAVGVTAAFVMQQRDAAIAIGRERDAAQAAATRAQGLRLAAQARLEAERDPAVAVAIALEAHSQAPGRDALEALYHATDRSRLAAELLGHEAYVPFVALTPDGRRMVTFDSAGNGIVWDVETARAVQWLDTGAGDTTAFTMSADGRFVFTGHRSGVLQRFDLQDPTARRSLQTGEVTVRAIALAPSGPGALVIYDDGRIVWREDVLEGPETLIRKYPRGKAGRRVTAAVHAATHTYPTRVFCWWGRTGELVAYDLAERKVLWSRSDIGEPQNPRSGPGPMLHQDGVDRGMVFVDRLGSAQYYDLATGEVRFEVRDEGEFNLVARLSRDGERLFIESRRDRGDPRVRWFETEDGSLGRSIETGERAGLFEVGPAGRDVLVRRGYDVELWSADVGVRRHELRGHLYRVRGVAFGPHGRWIATTSDDMVARLWHREAPGAREGLVPWMRAGAYLLQMDPEGQIALMRNLPDQPADAWAFVQTMSGSVLYTLPTAGRKFTHINADGADRFLAHDAQGRVYRLDPVTGEMSEICQLSEWHERCNGAIASPDGAWLFARDRDAEIPFSCWRLTDGARVSAFGVFPEIAEVHWAPDSRRIVAAHSGRAIAAVYDAIEGRTIAKLEGHSGYVLTCAWHPKGHQVATAAIDTSARVWDAETGAEIHRIAGLEMSRQNLSFHPQGHELMTSGPRVRRWRLVPGEFNARPIAQLPMMRGVDRMGVRYVPSGQDILFWSPGGRVRLRPTDPIPLARRLNVHRLLEGDLQRLGLASTVTQERMAAHMEGANDVWFRALNVSRMISEDALDQAAKEIDWLIEQRVDWPRPYYLRARLAARRLAQQANEDPEDRNAIFQDLEKAIALGMQESVRTLRLIFSDPEWKAWADNERFTKMRASLLVR